MGNQAIGGSIQEVSILGRSFAVASDADTQRKLGGFQNEKQGNGNGSSRTIKTRNGWSLTGLMLEINDSRGDQEYLQEIADMKDDVPISVTYADDSVYSGTGTIVDELNFGNMATTASVSFGGTGKLARQS